MQTRHYTCAFALTYTTLVAACAQPAERQNSLCREVAVDGASFDYPSTDASDSVLEGAFLRLVEGQNGRWGLSPVACATFPVESVLASVNIVQGGEFDIPDMPVTKTATCTPKAGQVLGEESSCSLPLWISPAVDSNYPFLADLTMTSADSASDETYRLSFPFDGLDFHTRFANNARVSFSGTNLRPGQQTAVSVATGLERAGHRSVPFRLCTLTNTRLDAAIDSETCLREDADDANCVVIETDLPSFTRDVMIPLTAESFAVRVDNLSTLQTSGVVPTAADDEGWQKAACSVADEYLQARRISRVLVAVDHPHPIPDAGPVDLRFAKNAVVPLVAETFFDGDALVRGTSGLRLAVCAPSSPLLVGEAYPLTEEDGVVEVEVQATVQSGDAAVVRVCPLDINCSIGSSRCGDALVGFLPTDGGVSVDSPILGDSGITDDAGVDVDPSESDGGPVGVMGDAGASGDGASQPVDGGASSGFFGFGCSSTRGSGEVALISLGLSLLGLAWRRSRKHAIQVAPALSEIP